MNSKLMLSADELLFLKQTETFILKTAITQKVYDFLGKLKVQLQLINEQNQFIFPEGTDTITGKISKGENYKGYPYIILDFPRLFSKEDIFSVRVMLWWGKYWSLHLHLSGKSWQHHLNNVILNLNVLVNKEIYISVINDEWNYEISETNFCHVNSSNFLMLTEKIKRQNFFRMASYTSIESHFPEEWILKQYCLMMQLFS
jgi:hypothetical protein